MPNSRPVIPGLVTLATNTLRPAEQAPPNLIVLLLRTGAQRALAGVMPASRHHLRSNVRLCAAMPQKQQRLWKLARTKPAPMSV